MYGEETLPMARFRKAVCAYTGLLFVLDGRITRS